MPPIHYHHDALRKAHLEGLDHVVTPTLLAARVSMVLALKGPCHEVDCDG